MYGRFSRSFLIGIFILFFTSSSSGGELQTQYSIIVYEHENQLRQFNREVTLGSLSYLVRDKKAITTEDEVRNKVDAVVQRVESILEMFPRGLKFKISLLNSDTDVQKIYRIKYGRGVDYIAFYSPREKIVYISVDDVNLDVLAHELTHVILDHYFDIPPSTKIHEVLAQFVETHLRD